jgi:hypothetical protein
MCHEPRRPCITRQGITHGACHRSRVTGARPGRGERVPLSGAARGRFGGDISIPALGRDLRGEAKVRANGFNRLYDWLAGRDFLVIRADRKPLLVVTTLELAADVVAMAERAKGDEP